MSEAAAADLGYDHAALRTLAVQCRNVERVTLALQRQVDAFLEDGWPPAALAWSSAQIPALKKIVRALKKEIGCATKGSRLDAWLDETPGLGPALFLVLGCLPPLTAFPNPSSLWRYAGLDVEDGESRKRKKGKAVGFNPWIRAAAARRVALPCVYHRDSAYRALYDQRRERTAVTHPDWSDGHSHGDGLRIVAKAVLRDAWCIVNERPMSEAFEGAQGLCATRSSDSPLERLP